MLFVVEGKRMSKNSKHKKGRASIQVNLTLNEEDAEWLQGFSNKSQVVRLAIEFYRRWKKEAC